MNLAIHDDAYITSAGEALAYHERIIERGLETFVEVGAALMAIRDGKEYETAGYKTFEQYCRQRWQMERAHAYRLMDAAQVIENLSPIGDILPATESQARPLAKLEPELQRQAWAEAVDSAPGGKVTAAHVDRIVEALTPGARPHVANNSGNNEWYTPLDFVEAARLTLGTIDLDPATSAEANTIVRAAAYYTIEDDGLAQAWRGKIWMNPPYAADLVNRFIAKLIGHYRQGDVPEAIVLVNNATETNWYQALAANAAAICFPARRIRFWSPNGGAGAPLQGQSFLYLGDDAGLFMENFSYFGLIVEVICQT